MAERIQARAIRRCGELLKQVEPSKGGRPSEETGKGTHSSSRRQAAKQAGMSPHQQYQATRIANVPEPDFNAAVESGNPPTVTKLAEEGKKRRLVDFGDTDPKHFATATKAIGHLHDLAALEQAEDADDQARKADTALPVTPQEA